MTGYQLEDRIDASVMSTPPVTLAVAAHGRPPEMGRRPPALTGSRQYLKTLSAERRASTMRVPTVRQSCHGGRWETIRYALDSNARTVRFCLIWIVLITSSILAAAIAVHGSSDTVRAVLHAWPWYLPAYR